MMNNNFQRKFVRAPLRSKALYVDGDHVFKAKTLNISEGGVLLCELPHVPEINAIPLMISLIQYPKLSLLSPEKIKAVNVHDLPKKIIKVKAKMARTYEDRSNVEKLFLTHIGCEFYPLSDDTHMEIVEYVNNFTKNVIHFLSLFESNHNKKDQIDLIRKIAEILGYDAHLSLPMLRQKVLHDYQSLESI